MGTLDTKSQEVKYLRDQILESGLGVIVLDNSVLGEPQGIIPDISSRKTAEAAGTTLKDVRKKLSRGEAINEMIKAVRTLLGSLTGKDGFRGRFQETS